MKKLLKEFFLEKEFTRSDFFALVLFFAFAEKYFLYCLAFGTLYIFISQSNFQKKFVGFCFWLFLMAFFSLVYFFKI